MIFIIIYNFSVEFKTIYVCFVRFQIIAPFNLLMFVFLQSKSSTSEKLPMLHGTPK